MERPEKTFKKFSILLIIIGGIFILSQSFITYNFKHSSKVSSSIVISPNPPADVTSITTPYPTGVTLTDLATFAWQEFIAYNYPADPAVRGQYEVGSSFGGSGPRVWETFWHRNEIFPYNESPAMLSGSSLDPSRSPKYQYDPAGFTFNGSYGGTGAIPDSTLWNNLSEIDELGVDQMFSDNKVDNEHRILYEAKMNRAGTNYILGKELYKADTRSTYKTASSDPVNLTAYGSKCNITTQNIVCLPCGSGESNTIGNVEIKAAWKLLTDDDDPSKYYTNEVIHYLAEGDPIVKNWYVDVYALIGLHIISKTENFPSFVYATFEHIDNENAGIQYIDEITQMNRGGGDTAGDTVLVERVNPIPAEVESVTATAHSAMGNVVWQNYKLTGVQAYPLDYEDYLDGTDPSNLSHDSSTYYLANLVVESNSELQSFRGAIDPNSPDVKNMYKNGKALNMGGCMGCHGIGQESGGDFNFLIANAPFSSPEFVGSNIGINSFREINNYEDVLAMFDDFVSLNKLTGEIEDSAPHHAFWDSLTYDQFITDSLTVYGNKYKIVNCGHPDNSDIVEALEGMLAGVRQMPGGGPYFPENQIEEFKTWIKDGCPNGDEGAYSSINWGSSKKYDTGGDLSVAMDDSGNVVDIHRGSPGGQYENTHFYRVGKVNFGNKTISWGTSTKYDTGSSLSVAMDNNGNVVEIHRGSPEGQYENSHFYRVGKVNFSNKTISWGASTKYDTGSNLSVALDNNGNVVDTHRGSPGGQYNNSHFYRVGKVNYTNKTISWGASTKYDTGSNLSVAMDDNGNVVDTHRGSPGGQYENSHFYLVGKVNFSNKTISWGASTKYDTGSNLSVALDNNGNVVDIHRGSPGGQYNNSHFYLVGKVDYSKKTIKWNKSTKYDTGSNLSVAIDNSGNVVDIHQGSPGASSQNYHNYLVGKLIK